MTQRLGKGDSRYNEGSIFHDNYHATILKFEPHKSSWVQVGNMSHAMAAHSAISGRSTWRMTRSSLLSNKHFAKLVCLSRQKIKMYCVTLLAIINSINFNTISNLGGKLIVNIVNIQHMDIIDIRHHYTNGVYFVWSIGACVCCPPCY